MLGRRTEETDLALGVVAHFLKTQGSQLVTPGKMTPPPKADGTIFKSTYPLVTQLKPEAASSLLFQLRFLRGDKGQGPRCERPQSQYHSYLMGGEEKRGTEKVTQMAEWKEAGQPKRKGSVEVITVEVEK